MNLLLAPICFQRIVSMIRRSRVHYFPAQNSRECFKISNSQSVLTKKYTAYVRVIIIYNFWEYSWKGTQLRHGLLLQNSESISWQERESFKLLTPIYFKGCGQRDSVQTSWLFKFTCTKLERMFIAYPSRSNKGSCASIIKNSDKSASWVSTCSPAETRTKLMHSHLSSRDKVSDV